MSRAVEWRRKQICNGAAVDVFAIVGEAKGMDSMVLVTVLSAVNPPRKTQRRFIFIQLLNHPAYLAVYRLIPARFPLYFRNRTTVYN